MDSQQELFTALKVQLEKALKSKGINVYDTFLPSEGTPYPYVYIGSSQLVDDYGNKTMILGNITQVVDVWHNNPRKRGELSEIMQTIKKVARQINHTNNFAFMIQNINQRILSDSSTGAPLMHGVLELDFRITGGIK